jgi:hypothetical protein
VNVLFVTCKRYRSSPQESTFESIILGILRADMATVGPKVHNLIPLNNLTANSFRGIKAVTLYTIR